MTYIQQLLKGLVEPIILSIIARVPTYGYQIGKEMEKRGEQYLKLKGGTIYPALLRLERKGLVTSKWRPISRQKRRKYYSITEKGRQFLVARLLEWRDFSEAINKFLPMPLSDNMV